MENIDELGSFFEDIISMLMNQREPKEPFIDTLTDDDVIDMTSTVYEMADEYLNENILEMSDPNFHKRMIDDITSVLFDQWEDAELCSHGEDDDDQEDDYHDVHAFIHKIIDDYFAMSRNWYSNNIPVRSNIDTFATTPNRGLKQKIDQIRSIPQPAQRTNEWYEFRHGLITASNLYKVFGSESLCNSLIYEKCLPLNMETDCVSTYVNTSSPMHWGQKYEPVSVMIYEKIYGSNVEEFGCVQHPAYPYIGASPDGIITDPESDRYGRMLEIKNIVNRDITVPSKAYWIQMQMQMETCDLDECDFLETRFHEYENEEQFYEEHFNDVDKHKGVILYFIERSSMCNSPKYVYMPFSIGLIKQDVCEWIENTKTQMRGSWSLYTTIYWKLEELSCILVERNRPWFKSAQPHIANIWNTILLERENGFEHRATKKKITKIEVVNGEGGNDSKLIKNLPILGGGVCLVKLE